MPTTVPPLRTLLRPTYTVLPPRTSSVRRAAAAVLRSPVGGLLDGLAAPHGLDRYLELVDPLLARDTDRAVVTGTHRETSDTTTLTLLPNRWAGHLAGQYVEVSLELDGRRFTRCYSVSSSQHRGDGQFTITVKADPDGRVSSYLANHATPGLVLDIAPATGEFILPADRATDVLLVSAGSGITPVMSMLRTLVDEQAPGRITFLHYGRTSADIAFLGELRELERRHERLHVVTVLTREAGTSDLGLEGHLDAIHLDALGVAADIETYACGPASLLSALGEVHASRGTSHRLHTERFQLGAFVDVDPSAPPSGDLAFAGSGVTTANDGATILAQAEAAGLSPQSGCRMGICHTCIRPKISGQVRDIRDGRLSTCDPEDVQICISVPVGDVTLDL